MMGHFDQEKEPFLDEKVDEYRVDQGLDPLDEKRLLDSQQPFPQPQVVPAAPPVAPEGDDIARRAQDVLEILHRARETTESSAREALALEFKALHMKGLRRGVRPDIVKEAVALRLRSLPLDKGRALGIEYDSLVAVVKYKDAVSKKETKRILWVLLGYAIATPVFWVFRDFISEHAVWGPYAAMAGVLVITLFTALITPVLVRPLPHLSEHPNLQTSNLSTRFYDLRATGLTFVTAFIVLLQTINGANACRHFWTAGAWYSVSTSMPFSADNRFWVVATQPAVRINLWRQPAEGKLCRPWAAKQKETAQRKKNRKSFRRNWRVLLVPIGGASLIMFVVLLLGGAPFWPAVGMTVLIFVVSLIMAAWGAFDGDTDDVDAATTDEEAVGDAQSPVALGAGPSDRTVAPVS
ncbi:uncharacterized protein EHS24_009310 [Apiotrichum porosum]|uniref:Uncharacterized protein n=1 Tax=Apiotrichum porosum TaxID=105984 RepID=A0A427XLF5_9TREE|nr:uncharacterized protein EHS24_009310 [Apiotrichum porosum]RSH79658.1 hypothetical protein EHS24_009310 [Apiotrichum porosum]